ncbi:MAG: UDP-N-acetylmuramoyl-tripeptide--D-alanyl-D-alanine ligase, partial [Alicyclobacillus sp.]|nr:UDP-N-acetylmuramoyl-tripeptide--D-alanyl-D-alanine ligase [Alicyclobacillus sp.]
MLPITAEELALAVHGVLVQGDGSARVDHVVIDSRKAGPGAAFVAFVGARQNGHQFVHDVVRQGAAAAIVTETVDVEDASFPIIRVQHALAAVQLLALRERRSFSGPVIGVTGSNGKTTTKDMVYGLLASTYKVQKTEGNLNNHIGVPLTLLRLKEDTEIAVVEMGMSNFGEIELLSKISEPSVAIITNIGESHLQELGSRDGIARAKLEIVSGLQSDGVFVYYGDEP